MTLTRDELRADAARKQLQETTLAPRLWSDQQLARSREHTFAAWDGCSSVWVFGYGSLIWNPQLAFVKRELGKVFGYHRTLCLWSRVNRGTPERPGLVFGLQRGGSCAGVAYEIAAANVEHEMELLWRREMLLGSYLPTWLQFKNERGIARKALTFCVDPLGPGYAGDACETEIIAALRFAKGRYGTCLTYVNDTVEALRAHGITDRKLNALLARACNVKRIG